MNLDTEYNRATPEGVNLAMRVAGPLARALAWSLDLLIITIVTGFSGGILALLGGTGQGLQLILLFIVSWFYPVAFEVLRRGATPGKAAFGLSVVHDDGTPVAPVASLLRNLMRFADFLPIGYATGLLTMIGHREFKRLGDIVAGTLVVYRDEMPPEPAEPDAHPVAPPVQLNRLEQKAIVDFSSRVKTWSEERRAELANILLPITKAEGPKGVQRLLGMASWILGRRANIPEAER